MRDANAGRTPSQGHQCNYISICDYVIFVTRPYRSDDICDSSNYAYHYGDDYRYTIFDTFTCCCE